MKLALRGLAVVAIAAVVTQGGAAAPAHAKLHITPDTVVFWTPRVGLLGVGVCASRKYECGSGAVKLTVDGGRTYRTVLRTRYPVETLQTAGPRGAIAVTADKRVFRTLDRGRTWTRWHVRSGASFATPNIGLGSRSSMVGNRLRGVLLRTTNGGRTWHRLKAPSGLCAWATEIAYVTPKLAWMVCVGQPGAGNEMKAVFRSRDGGRTWRMGAAAIAGKHSVDRGGIGFLGYPAGIAFAPDGFGVMWESRGTVYVTRDGGKNWHAKRGLAMFDVDFGQGGAAFSNGTGFVLLRRGGGLPARLVETRDAGHTWHVVRHWRR